MKITLFSILAIIILQITSIINIGHMFSQITGRYGANLENLSPKVENPLFIEQSKSEKLEVRF